MGVAPSLSSAPAPTTGNSRLGRDSSRLVSVRLLDVPQCCHLSSQATASRGEKSHLFLRSGERRLHYTGSTKVLMVRSYGHTAGFDETGNLRIY